MDEAIPPLLKKILIEHGPKLIDEPRRCENLFEIFPPSAKLERAVLIATLREGVPKRLISTSAASVTAAFVRNYAAQIAQQSGLQENVAHWAVETWAYGLGSDIVGPFPPGTVPNPQPPVSEGRRCPYCSAPAPERICPSCRRDTMAPRRPCPQCGRLSPTSESKCWNCGTPFKSELRWKIALIIALFVLAFVVNFVLAAIR
jgi:hypothetical protein